MQSNFGKCAQGFAAFCFISAPAASYYPALVLGTPALILLALDTRHRAQEIGWKSFVRSQRLNYAIAVIVSIALVGLGNAAALCMGIASLVFMVEIFYENPSAEPPSKTVASYFLLATGVGWGVFIFVSSYVGGAALNGRIEDGYYFLSQHGVDRAVPRSMFLVSAAFSALLGFCTPVAATFWIRECFSRLFREPFSRCHFFLWFGIFMFWIVGLGFFLLSVEKILKAL